MPEDLQREIEILLSPAQWFGLQEHLQGPRSSSISARIEHSLRTIRREADGRLRLIFSEADGALVIQGLRVLESDRFTEDPAVDQLLADREPAAQTSEWTIPPSGTRCQAYRLSGRIPGDPNNRCIQRSTRRIQVRHRGELCPLNLCTQHAKMSLTYGNSVYFVVGTDLIGVGHPR